MGVGMSCWIRIGLGDRVGFAGLNGELENRVVVALGHSAGRLGIVGVGSLGLWGGASIVEGIGDGQSHGWRERE